ncbi:MAG: YdcF family protein [Candidatus Acidiferrales bacterium]
MSAHSPTPPATPAASYRRSRNSTCRGAFLLLLILLVAAAIFAFRHAGRWLIRQDPLEHADVILVLSGSTPYRAEEAAAVYRQGYASEVWLTSASSPAQELKSLGVPYTPDEEYDRQVLIKLGVPASAIRILPETVINTEQEVAEVSRELQRAGKSSIIIVTSAQHTRRSGVLWRIMSENKSRAILHVAPQDPFDADRWWSNTRDVLAVIREWLGILNAELGLPVRPHHSVEPPAVPANR